jgi:hypothetical protein
VIDTGIDYFHVDLQNRKFINPGEMGIDAFGNDKRTNGIDDDNNGFIDDFIAVGILLIVLVFLLTLAAEITLIGIMTQWMSKDMEPTFPELLQLYK